MNRPQPAELESWYRERLHAVRLDISSSGVEPYSLGELASVLGWDLGELESLVLADSDTPGSGELREALARRFCSRPDEVFVTHGSTEALFLVIHALVGPGDEVVVAAPAYHALTTIPAMAGARVRPWRLPLDGRYPDIGRLVEMIRPSTRALIVNFPHNPTGTVIAADDVTAILAACSDAGVAVVWDAAMAELAYEAPVPNWRRLGGADVIEIGTLSKAYGLPGLRIGWCIAPPAVLSKLVGLRDVTTLLPSLLDQAVATVAVTSGSELIGPRLAQAARNREAFRGWLATARPDVSGDIPQAGVSAFPRFHLGDTDGLCDRLAVESQTLVVPGRAFGVPDHFRIGIGGPGDDLREGLERLSQAVRKSS